MKTEMKKENLDTLENKVSSSDSYNFITGSNLPDNERGNKPLDNKTGAYINITGKTKTEKQLEIKDFDSKVPDLPCIKKDYFFILEKKSEIEKKKNLNSNLI